MKRVDYLKFGVRKPWLRRAREHGARTPKILYRYVFWPDRRAAHIALHAGSNAVKKSDPKSSIFRITSCRYVVQYRLTIGLFFPAMLAHSCTHRTRRSYRLNPLDCWIGWSKARRSQLRE